VPPDDVDVQRFESLVELAEREMTSDPSRAERYLHDARLLWRPEGSPASRRAHGEESYAVELQ
jgi:hypothetical protein